MAIARNVIVGVKVIRRNTTDLLLLAGGNSSRMGQPKQLLSYRGQPLVRHAALQAIEAACGKVIVVIGANANTIRFALKGLDLQIVENHRWAEGMGTSIRAGLESLDDGAESVLLALADQPSITADHYRRLVEIQRETNAGIVASEYSGTLGVPALFTQAHLKDLLELSPREGCKRVILNHKDSVVRMPCPEAALDIDTPADYERLLTARRPI